MNIREQMDLQVELRALAQQLPTARRRDGAPDPDAPAKFRAEVAEFDGALAAQDWIGALLELGDLAYYYEQVQRLERDGQDSALYAEHEISRCLSAARRAAGRAALAISREHDLLSFGDFDAPDAPEEWRLLAALSRLDLTMAYRAAVAKFRLRAQPGNPKDDEAERAAIRELVSQIIARMRAEQARDES